MFQSVIGDGDGKPILTNLVRQSARHRPRSQDAVFFQTQVEVRTRLAMVVQHEGGVLHGGHPWRLTRDAQTGQSSRCQAASQNIHS